LILQVLILKLTDGENKEAFITENLFFIDTY